MKGDFTRLMFDRGQRYAGVLRQQGRVDLDADWNEQHSIQARLARLLGRDVIGGTGAPKHDPGFEIGASADGTDLTIGAGRMYVDGIVVELDEAVTYSAQSVATQPPLLEAGTDADGRIDLVYLEVWQRQVTIVEDPSIAEPALDGLDTTTRLQTVWRVRTLEDVANADCDDAVAGWPPQPATGRLEAAAAGVPAPEDPCAIAATGGYRGVENRLYRVEIHESGALGSARFKWSRDNGSVLFTVEEFMAGTPDRVRLAGLGRDRVLTLRIDDRVELLDDAAELGDTPGFMARVIAVDSATRIVRLDRAVPADTYSIGQHARIHRWDQSIDLDADGLIDTAAGPIELEDGVEVSFSAGDYRAGDYWTFAARAAGGTVDSVTGAAPHGVERHYCRLALIRWESGAAGSTIASVADCRPLFPALTELTASDVSYDNTQCDLSDAVTVQDALDRLCAERDLRFHNKHLHGWGVVCGLQVQCGPDTAGAAATGGQGGRRQVTVRSGYAIDCEGNDILIRQDRHIDVIAQLEAQGAASANGTALLDANGDGRVCLELRGDGEDGIRVAAYPERAGGWRGMLRGTLLMDFIEGCIGRVIDFFRDEFTPAPEESDELVGPTQKRLTTLGNLLVQIANPDNGRYVFLSRREHDILRGFYERLLALLHSRTYCGMVAGSEFPDYPFEDDAHTTIFGKGFHTRLRLHPQGRLAYTTGAGNAIHVYDLERETMVATFEMPGGVGVAVQDVAISADGRALYAIGHLGHDTLFAVADIDGLDYRWRPATVICDVPLVTLAVPPGARHLLAIGRGMGLYQIDPENVQARPQSRASFNAAGHLVINAAGTQAFATALENGAPTQYDRVLRIDLRTQATPTQFLLRESGLAAPVQLRGNDDIALVETGQTTRLYAVANAATAGQPKRLFSFDAAATGAPQGAVVAQLEHTYIRLAAVGRFLAITFEDSYRVGLLNAADNRMVEGFRHPVQVSPRAIAVLPREGGRVYVLNGVSNTLSAVPVRYMTPEGRFPSPQLETLARYRDGVLQAYFALLGNFLQYLKDCFCDKFLVDCPECDEDEPIYLASVEIRGGRVERVCNFSLRKYVKSFPTVEYWLSAVPVLPLVSKLFEKFCCSAIAPFFSRMTAPAPSGTDNRVSAAQLRTGVSFGQLDWSALLRQRRSSVSMLGDLASDWLGALSVSRSDPEPPMAPSLADRAEMAAAAGMATDSAVSQPATVRARDAGPDAADAGEATLRDAIRTGVVRLTDRDVVGESITEAEVRLAAAGVEVAGVERYDPAAGAANLLRFGLAPRELAAGERVVLFERDGEVRYYAKAERAAAEVGSVRVAEPELAEEVVSLKHALRALQEEHEKEVEQHEAELVELRRGAAALQEEMKVMRTHIERLGRK